MIAVVTAHIRINVEPPVATRVRTLVRCAQTLSYESSCSVLEDDERLAPVCVLI